MSVRDVVEILLFAVFIIAFSLGGVFVAWIFLPWIAATVVTFLALLFWPMWIGETLFSSAEESVFSGQIDHPGGAIGMVIAVSASLLLSLNGRPYAALVALIAGSIVLGVTFSLVSEWLETRIINMRTRWKNRNGRPP